MHCVACSQKIDTENDDGYTSFSGVEQGFTFVAFIHLACLAETQETQKIRRVGNGNVLCVL